MQRTVKLPALLSLAVILCAVSTALAEPGNITGKVLDAKTKDPLPFANVVVMGTGLGGMSWTTAPSSSRMCRRALIG